MYPKSPCGLAAAPLLYRGQQILPLLVLKAREMGELSLSTAHPFSPFFPPLSQCWTPGCRPVCCPQQNAAELTWGATCPALPWRSRNIPA